MTVLSPSTTVTSLLTPFTLGSLELQNRIVMAPMTREFAPGGVPSSDAPEYYARRARGGVGLIITEGTVINAPGAAASPNVPRFHGADALDSWHKVVQAVHSEGGKIIPQLWHVGLDRDPALSPEPDEPNYGPGKVFGSHARPATRMTQQHIDQVLEAFGEAAATAELLGFDGVELHGGHGYLIDQFLWAETNQREDRYGGSIENRSRFAAEIVAEVRRRVSPSFPIIFRFSQWKTIDFAARPFGTPAELEAALTPLVRAGVSAFHASTRRFWEPAFEGTDMGLAAWAKKTTGLPAITVGSAALEGSDFVGALLKGEGAEPASLIKLEEQLAREEYDLVALGRALISDPNLVNKVAGLDLHPRNPFNAGDLAQLI